MDITILGKINSVVLHSSYLSENLIYIYKHISKNFTRYMILRQISRKHIPYSIKNYIFFRLLNIQGNLNVPPSPSGGESGDSKKNHAKKFCSETTVWESCYKLLVSPQVVSVFIPIDLTKWNRFHC